MVKFLINKPIAVLMSTLGIIILGLYFSASIPVSLMPDIDIPEITVQLSAENMPARQIEDIIVKPLRSNLKQISHLKDIKSEVRNGTAIIRLVFDYNAKIDYSFIEVNEKIDRAMGSFPKTMKRPKVIKASATDIPVFYLNMTLKKDSTNLSKNNESYPVSQKFIELSRFVDQVIRKRIEQVNEVAMVDVSGSISSEILIIPNSNKIEALGIDLNELESAIIKNDIEIGSLLIMDNQYQYDVRLGGTLNNIQQIRDIYINKGNNIYQLKELANIIQQPKKRIGMVLSNGDEAITMGIIKQSDARIGDLKASLKGLLMHLKEDYQNINFTITRDQTKLLDYAINNLFQSLLWGMFLAFGVMFLFLKDLKSPLIICITIPVSLIICLLFFYFFGISINIISLSGLVLGIGLMIDNSIIVIDNITQFKQQGIDLNNCCIMGTNEVIKPLFSSSLTTCAVFLPLIFLSGISGALFFDQAMAISIGLFVSFIVSITLLPTLYRLFHLSNNKNRINIFFTRINKINYSNLYKRGFSWVMRKQKTSWILSIALFFLAIGLFIILPKKQIPSLTKTETLFKIDWNEEINAEENKKRVLKLLNSIKDRLITQTALIGAQQFLLDKDPQTKASESNLYFQCRTPEDLIEVTSFLNSHLKKNYPLALYKHKDVENLFNLIFSTDNIPLIARLRSINNSAIIKDEELELVLNKLQNSLSDVELKPISRQEYMILKVDKEKLMIYDVNTNTLFNNLKSAFNEREITSITDNYSFIPVILGGTSKQINNILNETTIKSNDSTLLHVKNFVEMIPSTDIKTITGGIEGEYYPLEFNIKDSQVNSIIKDIKKVFHENEFFNISFSGDFLKKQELFDELKIILLISLILLYFILATQFESFNIPFILLLEIPLDLAGAFLFLKIFGISINLMSLIGIVVMSGIIINDSILKIDTTIQLQRKGYSLMRALIVSGQRRLKPILMTSLTTILALFPLLFSSGIGAELQTPLAISLIGGMLFGTIVSLYFIPLCYYYLKIKK